MHRILCAFAGLSTILLVAGAARADDFVVRVDNSRVCQVDVTSEVVGPQVQIAGPYGLLATACNEALGLYDKDGKDFSKCWSYVYKTREKCHYEGQELPDPKN